MKKNLWLQQTTRLCRSYAIIIICSICFPFAAMAQCYGPGGDCTQLKMWIRADSGLTNPVDGMKVSIYRDQSLITSIVGYTGFTFSGSTSPVSGYTLTQPVIASQPKWYSGSSSHGLNYNPVFSFDGADDFLATNASSFLTAGGFTGANSLPTIGIAGISRGYAKQQAIIGGGTAANNLSLGIKSITGAPYIGYFAHDSLSGTSSNINEPFILAANRVVTSVQAFNLMSGGMYGTNKEVVMQVAPIQSYNTSTGGNWEIGRNQNANTVFNGDIAEIYMYNTNGNKTWAQLSRKNSYFAVKYGITLDTPYYNVGSTLIWDPAQEPTYHHDVVGIGIEASENLRQKQSHTTDDSLRIFLGTLAADNASNAVSTAGFFNNGYMMVGHNTGQLYATDSVQPEVPAGIHSRLEREWKLHNSHWGASAGTPGTFSLELKLDGLAGPLLPANAPDLRLLVSGVPDMRKAVIYKAGDDGIAFTISSIHSVIISGLTAYNTGIPSMGVYGKGGVICLDSVRYITLASAAGTTPLSILGLLPLNLISFNADAIDNSAVILSWQTGKNNTSKMFSVERSATGQDWQQLAQSAPIPNAPEGQLYQLTDYHPHNGMSFYRLKLTGTNGEYSYTPAKSVKIEKMNALTLYPNPASGQVTIKGDAMALKTLKLYNLTGQDVSGFAKVIKNANTSVIIDVSALPAGIYNFKAAGMVAKMIKK